MSRHAWRLAAGALTLASLLAAPSVARAAPPDDWSLERDERDDLLVEQRLRKLHTDPWSSTHWRPLERALGKRGLARRLAQRAERAPSDVAWAILDARASRMLGEHAEAARKWQALQGRAGRHADRVFDARIDALEAAGASEAAVAALLERAEKAGPDAGALFDRAHRLAVRNGSTAQALAAAEGLAARTPDDWNAQLQLARAAAGRSDLERAAQAFARAQALAPARQVAAIVSERASNDVRRGQPAQAATVLWAALETSGLATGQSRRRLWDELESTERGAGRAGPFATRLGAWLAGSTRDDAYAWQVLARARQAAGMPSVAAWKRAVTEQPRDRAAHAGLIVALEQQGDTAAVRAAIVEADAQRALDVAVALDIAARMKLHGEPREAGEIFEGLWSRTRKDGDRLLLLLDWANEQGDAEQALAIARALVKSSPRDPDAYVALGEQLFQMNRVAEAVEIWSQLPRVMRPSHAGWAKLSELLAEHQGTNAIRRREMGGNAQAALAHALERAPKDPRYLRQRALLEDEAGTQERALDTWIEVRALAEKTGDRQLREEARTRIVDLLSVGTFRARATRKAELEKEAWRKLERLDHASLSSARDAGRFLAELYAREDMYDRAADALAALAALDPQDADVLMDLAMAQRRADRVADAIVTLQQIPEIDASRAADALALLSEIAHDRGESDAALGAARRASTLGSDNGRSLMRLAELRLRSGDVDGAQLAADAALSIRADDPQAKLLIAELALARGDMKGSRAALLSLMGSDAPDDVACEAGRRALDMVERPEHAFALLDAAIVRGQRSTQSDEVRELLLEITERLDARVIARWLDGEGTANQSTAAIDAVARRGGLRTALVSLLSRGSASMRGRAATTLGELALPDTAQILAQVGASLRAPADAPRPVLLATKQTRVTALIATASLADPRAVDLLDSVARITGSDHAETAAAATWALGSIDAVAARDALRRVLEHSHGSQVHALACAGLFRTTPAPERRRTLEAVRPRSATTMTTDSEPGSARATQHACALAEASVRTDAHAKRWLTTLLDEGHSDGVELAIAVWRVGELPDSDAERRPLLWRAFVASRGLPASAARAALRMRATAAERRGPAWSNTSAWSVAIERWIQRTVEREGAAVMDDDTLTAAIAADREHIASALARTREGTPAQRSRVASIERACPSSATHRAQPSDDAQPRRRKRRAAGRAETSPGDDRGRSTSGDRTGGEATAGAWCLQPLWPDTVPASAPPASRRAAR